MEIEVPVREPRTFSHIKRHGRHVLQLKTVLLTIYYPASPPNNGNHKPSRQLWLGRPRLGVAKGYGKFATVGSLGIPMFLPTMFTKIPAWRNAPLSHRLPGDDKSGADSEEDGDPPQFPLMVFSHGLGGTRTAYSTVCGEVITSVNLLSWQRADNSSSRVTALWFSHWSTEMVRGREHMSTSLKVRRSISMGSLTKPKTSTLAAPTKGEV